MTSRGVLGLAATAALLVGAAAGCAHAADANPSTTPPSVSTNPLPSTRSGSQFASDAPWSAEATHKQLQWDSKGRWGLRLDMAQPTLRDPGVKDMAAGAFFRITPSLQINGTVGLGDRLSEQQLQHVTPQDASPQVHLETAFRF